MGTNSRTTIAEQQPRLIEMYQAGASYAEIATELGLSEKGVSYRVRPLVAAGVLVPRRGGNHGPQARTRGTAADICQRYEAGETWEDIAAAVGLTVETVRYHLRQEGVERDRATPRWVDAQHWPWPLTLAEVAQRLYGSESAADRRHARMLVANWLADGKLQRVGWARYDLPRRGS